MPSTSDAEEELEVEDVTEELWVEIAAGSSQASGSLHGHWQGPPVTFAAGAETATVPAVVPVLLRGMDGKSVEVQASAESDMFDIKALAAKEWGIAPELQALVFGARLVEDDEPLGPLLRRRGGEGGAEAAAAQRGAAAAEFTVVASADRVYRHLESRDPSLRRGSLEALARMAPGGGAGGRDGVLRRAAALLEDEDEGVRLGAVEVLRQVAERRDGEAIAEVASRLEHPAERVRGAAVLALEKLAEKGDMRAIDAAAARLCHPEAAAREAALEALARVTDRGDDYALDAVGLHLEHPSLAVRLCAFEALVRIADSDDGRVLAAAERSFLGHHDAAVRLQALRLLSEQAAEQEDGHPRCRDAVLEKLQDEDARVRAEAVRSLARISSAGPGGGGAGAAAARQAVDLLLEQFKDPDAQVRQEAVWALRALGRGSPYTLSRVQACLDSDCPSVRLTAAMALPEVSLADDPRVLVVLKSRLESGDLGMKLAALRALARTVALGGQVTTVDVVAEVLEHPDPRLRAGAAEALAPLLEEGHGAAVSAACARLQHPDLAVRLDAERALDHAPRGHLPLVGQLCRQVQHEDSAMRYIAVRALAKLVDPGDERAVALLSKDVEHPSEAVRQAAAWAMRMVQTGGDDCSSSWLCDFGGIAAAASGRAAAARPGGGGGGAA